MLERCLHDLFGYVTVSVSHVRSNVEHVGHRTLHAERYQGQTSACRHAITLTAEIKANLNFVFQMCIANDSSTVKGAKVGFACVSSNR